MERLKRAYAAFEDYLSGGLLFLGLTLIMVNIFLRYFVGKPQSWIDEFSVYFVVWGILLGLGVALRNDHHIKVDMLYNLLPLKIKRVVSLFAHSLGLSFCFLFTFYGLKLVNSYIVSGQKSTDSQFPLWIITIVLPLSGIMFAVRFVDKIYQMFKNKGRDWNVKAEKGVTLDGNGASI